jgi:hypothetical protein
MYYELIMNEKFQEELKFKTMQKIEEILESQEFQIPEFL